MSTIAQKEAAYIDRLNELLGGGQTNLTLTLSQLEDLNKRSIGTKFEFIENYKDWRVACS